MSVLFQQSCYEKRSQPTLQSSYSLSHEGVEALSFMFFADIDSSTWSDTTDCFLDCVGAFRLKSTPSKANTLPSYILIVRHTEVMTELKNLYDFRDLTHHAPIENK